MGCGVGGDAGCDGGDVRRRAGRPRCVRRARCRVRGCLPDRERHASHAVRARERAATRDLLAAILRIAPWALAGAALIIAAGFVDGAAQADALAGRARRRAFSGRSLTGLERLARATGALRRASRADRDHRDRRVPGRHRPRRASRRARHRRDRRRRARVRGRTSFWLAYFDFFPIRGQQLLADRSGVERIALARDVYTYLHLPMVAGIVLFAFAMKTTLADVGDELDTVPALRALRRAGALPARVRGAPRACVAHARPRPAASPRSPARCCGRWRLVVPALVALALVTVVWVGLHAYELIWCRQARAETRALRQLN